MIGRCTLLSDWTKSYVKLRRSETSGLIEFFLVVSGRVFFFSRVILHGAVGLKNERAQNRTKSGD